MKYISGLVFAFLVLFCSSSNAYIDGDSSFEHIQIESGVINGSLYIVRYNDVTGDSGFVAQTKIELGFSLTSYLSKDPLRRWRTQMSEAV